MAEGSQVVGLGVVTGAAIRHSWLSLYDAIRTFTTTGIAFRAREMYLVSPGCRHILKAISVVQK
ncbi:hypothetical protein [Enterobacter hormaechei]|uniref:hypothetical protein n=1 Tax=Enterobacter hormaechei TaxID=158836 RepID=UPI001C8F817D|nr:hypothetical protein [Enterobacter hormaechei]